MSENKAFKGSWERPVKIDQESTDPLTLARMTDHNVRGMGESAGGGVEPDLAKTPVPSPSAEPVQTPPKSEEKAA